MSRMLPFTDHLLSRARHFQQIGRLDDALHLLGRLAEMGNLPPAAAEETHARLAEIHLGHQRYAAARRHLTAALDLCPDGARYHHALANALDQGAEAEPATALDHFRRSLAQEPDQPGCLSDFGLAALRHGDNEEGLSALRRAAELDPDDPEIVRKLALGLELLDRPEEAQRVVRESLFRHPRHAGFRKLYSDCRFSQTSHDQEAARLASRDHGSEDEPVVLAFTPTAGRRWHAHGRKLVRRDGASAAGRAHFGCAERKHA
jgi:tetratricopeptide (TPR) repeat protein